MPSYSTPYSGQRVSALPPGYMAAATAPGRAWGEAAANLGETLGAAIRQHQQNKQESEGLSEAFGLLQSRLPEDYQPNDKELDLFQKFPTLSTGAKQKALGMFVTNLATHERAKAQKQQTQLTQAQIDATLQRVEEMKRQEQERQTQQAEYGPAMQMFADQVSPANGQALPPQAAILNTAGRYPQGIQAANPLLQQYARIAGEEGNFQFDKDKMIVDIGNGNQWVQESRGSGKIIQRPENLIEQKPDYDPAPGMMFVRRGKYWSEREDPSQWEEITEGGQFGEPRITRKVFKGSGKGNPPAATTEAAPASANDAFDSEDAARKSGKKAGDVIQLKGVGKVRLK